MSGRAAVSSVVSKTVRIEGAGGADMAGLLVRPAQTLDPAGPAIIVVHDIFGLTEDTERIARRFAEAGYVVLAPDLFDRPELRTLCMVRNVVAASRGEGAAYVALEATRAALSARPDVDETRLGIVGFCLGGGFALMFAGRGGFGVCAPFYGAVPKSSERLSGLCATIAGFGAKDGVFGKGAARLQEHLEALGIPHEVMVYEDAGHSYMNQHDRWAFKAGKYSPLRAGHHAEAEAQSWARMLAFFERHL